MLKIRVTKKLYFKVIPFRIKIVCLISMCRVNKNYTDYLRKRKMLLIF